MLLADLIHAVLLRNIEDCLAAIRAALEAAADVDGRDCDGYTALHWVASENPGKPACQQPA